MSETSEITGPIKAEIKKLVKLGWPISGERINCGVISKGKRWIHLADDGHPDIYFLYRGIYVGLETKIGDGKLSEAQEEKRDEIEFAGGWYRIARSIGDFYNVIAEVNEYLAEGNKK